MEDKSKPFDPDLLVVGGFLIGFGTRWAGGCTPLADDGRF